MSAAMTICLIPLDIVWPAMAMQGNPLYWVGIAAGPVIYLAGRLAMMAGVIAAIVGLFIQWLLPS